MNARRSAELERLFDGEMDESEADALRAEAADDPDALRYLELLGHLRTLARAHDPTAAEAPAARRGPRLRRVLRPVLTVAAALLAWLAFPMAPAPRPDPEPGETRTPTIRATRAAYRPAARPRPDGPTEVGLHLWVNAPSRRPEQAARIVLARGAGPRGRADAREVLALELANDTPGAVGRVRDFTGHQRPAPQRRQVAPRRSSAVAPRT